MQWKMCQRKIYFNAHILGDILKDLIYALRNMTLRLFKRLY